MKIFIILVAMLCSTAVAANPIERLKRKKEQISELRKKTHERDHHNHSHDHDSDSDRDSVADSDLDSAHSVPELDANAGVSAAVLLGGGWLVFFGRRKKTGAGCS